MNARNLLVLGGTGFVGRSVVARAVSRPAEGMGSITVPSRHPARAKELALLPTVTVVRADVHDDAQLASLVAGHDAVINLVAILHGSAADFERVHVELPRRIVRACAASGVRRVIHVSALGAGADAPSNYLRSKAKGEAVLCDAALDVTVLRPSVIFGEHDRFLNLFAALQSVAPVVPLAGADARFQPVWVEDVARAILTCLGDDRSIGQAYECVGPHEYSLAQLVRLAGQWSGHRRAVLPLPEFAGRLQAAFMGLLPGEPLLSADNLDSMRVPNVATGRVPGLGALGIEPASLESIAPGYLHLGRTRLDAFRTFARRN